jgi:DNA polymerase-3 subunit delta'
LLPTIRSRCLGHTMVWPDGGEADQWLQRRASSRPTRPPCCARQAAGPTMRWRLAQSGRDPQSWALLARAMARGDAGGTGWPDLPAQAVDALQKLCHDLLAVKAGAAPRFFDAADLPPAAGAGQP